jgi:hypothetical protein
MKNLTAKDLQGIAEFNKIVKNYLKMKRLEKEVYEVQKTSQ